MKISVALIIFTFLGCGLHAPKFSIEGIKWDSIYVGAPNRIKLEGFDCDKLRFKIEASISIGKDGCTIAVKPNKYKL